MNSQSSDIENTMFIHSNERPKKTRKMFSAVFKKQIAEIVLSSPDKTYSTIAKQYGLTCNQVSKWSKEYLNPDTLWVKEIDSFTQNENEAINFGSELSMIQTSNPTIPFLSQANFAVDVSLPSGTKISISNLNADQLQTVLKICR